MLLTVLSHILDETVALRAGPGPTSSRQTPTEAAAETPILLPLTWQRVALGWPDKELRSAPFRRPAHKKTGNLSPCLGFFITW